MTYFPLTPTLIKNVATGTYFNYLIKPGEEAHIYNEIPVGEIY